MAVDFVMQLMQRRGMNLQAVLFGDETLLDRQEVAREAYNRVFNEAGLSWQWDAEEYARLCCSSTDGDPLDGFVRTKRTYWRNREDLQHLTSAVRRRHSVLCRVIAAELSEIDGQMLCLARAAQQAGLRLAAVAPSAAGTASFPPGMVNAQTHDDALKQLKLPAAACIAIECTTEGLRAAADAGIATLDKLSIPASAEASTEMNALTLLNAAHARNNRVPTAPRFLAAALMAGG